MNLSISIITIAYNSEKTIKQTIASVNKQNYPHIQHVFVDGSSTDNTLSIINSTTKSNSIVISEPDTGIYNAMNKGINRAIGDYILILNSDDYLASPNTIEEVVKQLKPESLNVGRIKTIRPNGSESIRAYNGKRWQLHYAARIPHPALFISQAQHQEVGTYDESLKIAADHDLILRMLKRYPINSIPITTTIMQPGISQNQQELSFREFRDVSIRHSTPAPIAYTFWILKLLKSRLANQT